MENRKSVIICMSPNCYMASIDLKDAYYSVHTYTYIHKLYLSSDFSVAYIASISDPN